MLEAKNVVKTFDGFRALDGVSMTAVSYTHLHQAGIVQPGPGLLHMELLPLEHIVAELFPPLQHRLVGGSGDQLLDPVHVLGIAQGLQMILVIGVVRCV